jgi:CheY-like chemotaxis protein
MRLLLIEDDRKAAKLLARGLREEGFVVDVAPTGEVGEEQAAVNEYDVIVLDWLLPGKAGIAVCRSLRARSGDPDPDADGEGRPGRSRDRSRHRGRVAVMSGVLYFAEVRRRRADAGGDLREVTLRAAAVQFPLLRTLFALPAIYMLAHSLPGRRAA